MQDIDLRGIIPAIVTPMTNEGELDLPALKRYVQWLAEQGPVALAVNVDTGEGPHLTAEEKRQTLETVAEAVAGKCKVIGGCLLYTSDAADERSSVDLGGRRII